VRGGATFFLASAARRDPVGSKPPPPGLINWKEVCKFLSGAFFVSAAVLFYLYLTNTPLPLLGMDVVISPAVSGLRSIAHFGFFLICFYLGFIRK
jgi:hypothetical protein